jgi:hypothetical protein
LPLIVGKNVAVSGVVLLTGEQSLLLFYEGLDVVDDGRVFHGFT